MFWPLRVVSFFASFGLVAGCHSAFAQIADNRTGYFSIYSGIAGGGINTHPTIGGSAMVPLSKFVAAGVETSYIPLGSGTLRVYPGIRATQSRLFDFAFSLQIRVPVKRRWMPYGTLSSGVLYNTYSIAAIQPGNSTVGSSESDTKFAFEGGGGVRYYIRDNWGVTGEYQYTVSSQNFSRLLWGVFYELDDSWPFRSRRGASRGQGIPR